MMTKIILKLNNLFFWFITLSDLYLKTSVSVSEYNKVKHLNNVDIFNELLHEYTFDPTVLSKTTFKLTKVQIKNIIKEFMNSSSVVIKFKKSNANTRFENRKSINIELLEAAFDEYTHSCFMYNSVKRNIFYDVLKEQLINATF